MSSIALILGGIACLSLCGLLVYRLRPQEGRPPSRWSSTDSSGTAVALALLLLLLTGVSLVLKGVF